MWAPGGHENMWAVLLHYVLFAGNFQIPETRGPQKTAHRLHSFLGLVKQVSHSSGSGGGWRLCPGLPHIQTRKCSESWHTTAWSLCVLPFPVSSSSMPRLHGRLRCCLFSLGNDSSSLPFLCDYSLICGWICGCGAREHRGLLYNSLPCLRLSILWLENSKREIPEINSH